ncbi:MAG: WYL domain-containing protein [Coriobacteriia bacterium]|nr:WYL domain-containing protein [Coriobacteriia bacterium]
MPDPAERLVNLALFLAAAREPVSAAQIQAQVAGYPVSQAESAFLRMFERDKEDLLSAGLVLDVVRSGDTERYRLDREATFAGELALEPDEAMLVRTAASAMLTDPSFPFVEDLRMALAKLTAAAGTCDASAPTPVVSLLADEAPAVQAESVAALARALSARKIVAFEYTNLEGRHAARRVEPLGVFARDGRWYLVGYDTDAAGMRVFAVARMTDLEINAIKPKSPDFDAREGFDIREWMVLPFQWGPDRFTALLRFSGPLAGRAGGLAGAQGVLEVGADGTVLWRVGAAESRSLAGWALANGPGIEVLEPAEAREALSAGLREVVAAHG